MYHYTGCGLDYVYLKNGFEGHDGPYGKAVSIHDMDGLHKLIIQDIVENHAELTGQEIRFLRIELDWSQKTLGEYLGKDAQSVARWEKGQSKIPGGIAHLLRLLMQEHIGGTVKVKDLIKRVSDLDRKECIGRNFEESEKGWKRSA